MSKEQYLIAGQTISFKSDPFTTPPEEAATFESSGAVVVSGGKILDTGPASEMKQRYPKADVTDYGEYIILPGFIDPHVHYPQMRIMNSWGSRLADWLENHAFPEEEEFEDEEHAEIVADQFVTRMLEHGTTSFCTFCTVHPNSVNAIMSEAIVRNMRIAAGKTCMDRNAPDDLQDTAQSAYDDSKALLDKWHGTDRLSYAITPRFAPTCSPEQLEMLGSLWKEHPDCPMQTHISEQVEEVALVKELHPDSRDYLDVYERHGLVGPGAMFGHGIHLVEREVSRLANDGGSIIHCPTSNTFMGSGLMSVKARKQAGLSVGLATDVGGGSSLSMFRTMAAAYEISQLQRAPLHPAQLLWLATAGNAKAMRVDDRIGNIAVGMEADLIVIDNESTEELEYLQERAEDFWDMMFMIIMMADERAVNDIWINGEKRWLM